MLYHIIFLDILIDTKNTSAITFDLLAIIKGIFPNRNYYKWYKVFIIY